MDNCFLFSLMTACSQPQCPGVGARICLSYHLPIPASDGLELLSTLPSSVCCGEFRPHAQAGTVSGRTRDCSVLSHHSHRVRLVTREGSAWSQSPAVELGVVRWATLPRSTRI